MPTTCWLQSLWPGYLGLGPIFSTSRSANIFQPSGHADTIWHGVSCWHFYMPIESTELTFVGKDLLFLFSKHAAKAHLCIYIYIMHISGFPAFFAPMQPWPSQKTFSEVADVHHPSLKAWGGLSLRIGMRVLGGGVSGINPSIISSSNGIVYLGSSSTRKCDGITVGAL